MKQRIAILPGALMEMARAISEISEERKEYEPLGEVTVDITDTLRSGDFDGASHFLSPGRCRLNIDRAVESEGTQRGLAETFISRRPFPLLALPLELQIPQNDLYEADSPLTNGPSACCICYYLPV
jgi:hypothetical protein